MLRIDQETSALWPSAWCGLMMWRWVDDNWSAALTGPATGLVSGPSDWTGQADSVLKTVIWRIGSYILPFRASASVTYQFYIVKN